MHFYEPAKGHGLPHSPFKAIVAPRPIGWISSIDEQGRVNLAPYSFFNAVCEVPPMLYFSSKGNKDSLRNVRATGEFVANLVTENLAGEMNLSVHIDPTHLKDGLFDTAGAHVMARGGYRGFYSVVDRLVEIARPSESSALAP
jgi:hypothetical protein